MKLLIGLGNPGKEYEITRHNIGFMVVDHLQQAWGFSDFKEEKKFFADISEGVFHEEKILLVKPNTYMNLSGKSIIALLNFYKLSSEDMIVIQDDLDIDFGNIRIKTDSSAGGHNGIKSIIQSLGSQVFQRVKIGISNTRRGRVPAEAFVLEKFSAEEQKSLTDLVIRAGEEVEGLLSQKVTTE